MNEKDEELQQLRKEVILLKNQKEIVIYDMNKQVSIDETPYQRKNMSVEASILLGRSHPRDDDTVDEIQLSESNPKKRLIISSSNNKELYSESKYTFVKDSDKHADTAYPNTRYASHNRSKLI